MQQRIAAQACGEQQYVSMPIFAVGLLAGGLVALAWSAPAPRWLSVLALLSGLAALFWRRCRRPSRVLWLALLIGAGLTGLHVAQALALQLPPAWEGREWLLRGRVEGLPQVQPRRTRFVLRVDDDRGLPATVRGRRLLVSWYDDYGVTRPGPRMALRAGAGWELALRLRAPRGLSNPGGFDSERHALAQRFVATALVRRGQTARQLVPPRGVDAWREAMAARIDLALPGRGARFVRALALGDSAGLEDSDWEILRKVGLTHLIAISGFHVGMVAASVALLAQALWWWWPALGRVWPRRQAAALAALGGGAGYALLTGLSLPTVRTLLMIAVTAVLTLARRQGSAVQSLAIALIAVLLYDPLSLLFAGFWLSFAGVAWLVVCLPTQRLPRWREFLAAQSVATVGLLPLTLALFGQVSLIGPISNLLAIPWWTVGVVPLALLGTALEAICAGGGIWLWRAAAWSFQASWMLFEALARLPAAAWWAAEPGPLALPLAIIGAFWLLMPRLTPGRWLGLLLWLPMLLPERALPASGEIDLLVMDVGQGLAVLVRTRHHALLYDAGPAVADGFDAGERVVLPALRASGVARLDRIVLSHADADHAGGYAAVHAQFPTALTLAPPGAPLTVAQRCHAGQRWHWDGVSFRFLHPPAGFPYLRNESSCVLRIETAHGSVLLAGDIGEVIERQLLREQPQALHADVVLLPHHGSAGSSQPSWVRANQARLALVSSGFGNRFGHPRVEVVQRWRAAGTEVLGTADQGALRVWVGAAGLQVREYRRWRARLWDAAERRRTAAILSVDADTAVAPED